jgi:hypothetical protein
MRLTRRRLIAGAAAGAAGVAAAGAGVYELLDRLADSPERLPVTPRGPEQHLLDDVGIVVHEGVEVVVPPLHHHIATGKLEVEPTRDALLAARRALEETLVELDAR